MIFWKELLFIFIIFICLASQFKSQYTVWTECSPQNDMIFWKKLLFIFIIFICLASQFKSQYTVWTECSPRNDMILWKNNWKKILFIFIIFICLASQSHWSKWIIKNIVFQLRIIFGIKIQQKTTNQSLGWCAVSYRTTLRLLCSLYTRQ